MKKIETPSSKWIVATLMTTVISVVAMIDAAKVQGVDLPAWVYLIGAILAPVAGFMKRENNPSSSAVEAAAHKL